MRAQKISDLRRKPSSSSKSKVDTVEKLKKKYSGLPTSFLFSIDKEIEFQCPIIDDYISKIEKCRSHLEKAKRAKNTETKDIQILTALYYLENLDIHLDTITRENFISLREVLKQWKNLALKAIDETKSVEKFLKIKWK